MSFHHIGQGQVDDELGTGTGLYPSSPQHIELTESCVTPVHHHKLHAPVT